MEVNPQQIFIEDYDFELTQNRIAYFPLPNRDQSKLLIFKKGEIKDSTFTSLPAFLPQNATLILNDTRVIEARLVFQKQTGAQIEIFCLKPFNLPTVEDALQQIQHVQWLCMIGGVSKWKKGQLLIKEITIDNKKIKFSAQYIEKQQDSFVIQFSWNSSHSFGDLLHAAGAVPLPPYIKREANQSDEERYQTIFATHKGSVAAPTAALHFTDQVFNQLEQKNIHIHYITLHVGAGTFKPVKSKTIEEHSMHAEQFTITKQTLRILLKSELLIAVGTTTLRTLESLHWLGYKLQQNNDTSFSLSQWEAYTFPQKMKFNDSIQTLFNYLEETGQDSLQCSTSLIIVPGYSFVSAQALITNFHQPRSTLLLLIAAFIGDDWKRVYEHALVHDYRFLSYGDSSLLWRKS